MTTFGVHNTQGAEGGPGGDRKAPRALEFLSQAYLLDQQIQTKMHRLSSLRSLAESMQSFRASEPVSRTRNVTAMEDAVIKITEAEAELDREIDRLVDRKREISDVIAEVQDPTLRLILEKRHLCFESWAGIAVDMGRTARWAQMRHKMALIAAQRILDRRAARNPVSS